MKNPLVGSTVAVVVSLLASLCAALVAPEPLDRLAWSSDGNYHDPDDIGAAAMMQALFWRVGMRERVVYVEHSSHVGANSSSQHAEMVVSAESHALQYLIHPDRVWDQHWDPSGSANALAQQINVSAAGRPLVFFQSGPWESMARGFDLADPSRHQYVKIISHSNWNDNHEHVGSHRTKDEFLAQYDPGGTFQGHTAPTYIKIDDQNSYAFRTNGLSNWNWLNTDHDLAFVYERTVASGSAQGDFSDAGMVFWYLTGIEHPSMTDIRNFLE